MKAESQEKVKETFKRVVRDAVKRGGASRWGEVESLAVIEELVGLLGEPDIAEEGFDAIAEQVRAVVNPSAFAQRLEKLPDGHNREKGTYDAATDRVVDARAGEPLVAHPAHIVRSGKGLRKGGLDL